MTNKRWPTCNTTCRPFDGTDTCTVVPAPLPFDTDGDAVVGGVDAGVGDAAEEDAGAVLVAAANVDDAGADLPVELACSMDAQLATRQPAAAIDAQPANPRNRIPSAILSMLLLPHTASSYLDEPDAWIRSINASAYLVIDADRDRREDRAGPRESDRRVSPPTRRQTG